MALDSASIDQGLHEAALRIAVRCRRVVQCCLREEEWRDCDEAFYELIREELSELLSPTEGRRAGNAAGGGLP